MIQIKDIYIATICVGIEATKRQEESLAGDIENWLMREKNVICKVEVK
jgi:hypothetical protein